jgi:hypothetical protein
VNLALIAVGKNSGLDTPGVSDEANCAKSADNKIG